MSEMIERVARAIYDAYRLALNADATWDEVCAMAARPEYPNARQWHALGLAEARAAIRAMREPTVDMEIAGAEQWMCEAAAEDRSGVNWRAMIDFALLDDTPAINETIRAHQAHDAP